MLIEVGNVANKKRKRLELSGAEARELVRLVEAMPIQRVGHGGLLLPALALALALAHDLTAYDALYLALASRKAARLFTADDRLAAVAQGLGLS
jgi:predicted nucleic acid-binding protein